MQIPVDWDEKTSGNFCENVHFVSTIQVIRTEQKSALKDYRKGEPMERVCVDIVGPFPVSGRGNKYALVVTDCFR